MAMFADIMGAYMKSESGKAAYGTGPNDVGPPEEKKAAVAQPDPAYVTGGTDASGATLQSIYATSAGIQPQRFTNDVTMPAITDPDTNPRQGANDGRVLGMVAGIASSVKLKRDIAPHKGMNRADHGGKMGMQDKIGKLMFEVQELSKEIQALKKRRK